MRGGSRRRPQVDDLNEGKHRMGGAARRRDATLAAGWCSAHAAPVQCPLARVRPPQVPSAGRHGGSTAPQAKRCQNGSDACVRVLMVGYQGGCSAGHCRDGARRATAAAAAAASNATIGVRRTACSECTKTAIKASVEPISTSQCGTREISSHDGNDLWSCADIFGRRPRIRRLGHRLNRKQIPEQYSSIR